MTLLLYLLFIFYLLRCTLPDSPSVSSLVSLFLAFFILLSWNSTTIKKNWLASKQKKVGLKNWSFKESCIDYSMREILSFDKKYIIIHNCRHMLRPIGTRQQSEFSYLGCIILVLWLGALAMRFQSQAHLFSWGTGWRFGNFHTKKNIETRFIRF